MYGKHWCSVRETLAWHSTAYLFLLASAVLIPHFHQHSRTPRPSHQQASRVLQAFGRQLAGSWLLLSAGYQLAVSAVGSKMNRKSSHCQQEEKSTLPLIKLLPKEVARVTSASRYNSPTERAVRSALYFCFFKE